MAVSGGSFVEELCAAFARQRIDLPVADGPPFRPGWVALRVPGWIVSAAAVRLKADGTVTWELPEGAPANAHYVALSREDGSFFGSHICTDLDLLAAQVLSLSTTTSPAPAPERIDPEPWTDLRALRRRRRAEAEPVRSSVDTTSGRLVAEADRDRLADDLSRISEERVVEHFPRTSEGRLELGVTVLLASYEPAEPAGRDRRCWLAAAGPARRTDPAIVAIGVAPLRGDVAEHRWDRTRWLWDPGATDPWRLLDAARREVPLGLPPGAIDASIGRTEGDDVGSAARRSQAAQDAGRFDEAFAVAGLDVSEHVRRILARQVVPLPDTHQDVERWWDAARQCLWRLDPFRTMDAVAFRHRLADESARSTPRRRWRAPMMKLGVLPGSPHLVRPCLALVAQRDGAGAAVDVVMTGSNRRVPRSEWERPIEVDLHRLHEG